MKKQDLIDDLKMEITSQLELLYEEHGKWIFSKKKLSIVMQDQMAEILESCLPIYYSDLAELLCEDKNFGFVEDIGLIPPNCGAYDIISASVYEYLCSEFESLLEPLINEFIELHK